MQPRHKSKRLFTPQKQQATQQLGPKGMTDWKSSWIKQLENQTIYFPPCLDYLKKKKKLMVTERARGCCGVDVVSQEGPGWRGSNNTTPLCRVPHHRPPDMDLFLSPIPGRGCVHIQTPSLALDYIHCTPNYRVQPLAEAEEECNAGGWMKPPQTAVPLKAQEWGILALNPSLPTSGDLLIHRQLKMSQ